MARGRKSWQEKLAAARTKASAPHRFLCEKTKLRFVVPSVVEVAQLLAHIPSGRLMTLAQMAEVLRQRHGVDVCCPMTTGILAWLIAHGADEAERESGARSLLWWRLLKSDGELNPKHPGAGLVQRRKLEAEAHRIVARGKRPFVVDWQRALVPTLAPRPPAPNCATPRPRSSATSSDHLRSFPSPPSAATRSPSGRWRGADRQPVGRRPAPGKAHSTLS